MSGWTDIRGPFFSEGHQKLEGTDLLPCGGWEEGSKALFYVHSLIFRRLSSISFQGQPSLPQANAEL